MKNRLTRGAAMFGAVYVGGYKLIASVASAFGVIAFDRAPKVAIKAITGAALHAGVLNWQNPESSAILILRVIFDVTTDSTGASTTDIGTTATSATTQSDNLIDGVDSGTAPIVADNLINGGTNGKASQKLAAGKWVTFKEASGDATGLVANAYIEYVVI